MALTLGIIGTVCGALALILAGREQPCPMPHFVQLPHPPQQPEKPLFAPAPACELEGYEVRTMRSWDGTISAVETVVSWQAPEEQAKWEREHAELIAAVRRDRAAR